METIAIDIETIPSQSPAVREEIGAGISPPGNMSKPETIAIWEREKKPELVEQAWRRTSFDGALGQIVAISWALGLEKPQVVHAGKDWPKLASEAWVIATFFKRLQKEIPQSKQMGLVWVGHWVNEFDLRFIFQRAVIHGLKPPHFIPFNHPAWDDRVFDTMVQWSGPRGKIGLDKLCRVLGISSKGLELGGDDIDGSKVWDYVRDGKIEDVAAYCVGDVERVREVHQRMTFGGGS